MKNYYLALICLAATVFSCTKSNQESGPDDNPGNLVNAPVITRIIDLPDSLKPKTVFVDNMPAPRVVAVPKGIVRTMLPVLRNSQGKPVLNQRNSPFLLGEGGRSQFKNFTSLDGLALDGVVSSAEDRYGNLWFGTFGGGVSRYDGSSFTTFTSDHGLAGNRVWSIAEDKEKNMWFGTWGGGVSRYDGNCFTTYTTKDGLAGNIVWSIEVDSNGHIWFGTDNGGVSRFDGENFFTFTTEQGLADNRVWSIFKDENSYLWFGTDEGVSRYDGNRFVTYTEEQGLANNEVRSIHDDRNGNIWFGTFGGGVSRFDGNKFTTYTRKNGLANNVVRSIAEDNEGNLWFGTFGGGVSRYDGNTFVTYTDKQGLADNIVRSITLDKNGHLWFGTWGGGISRYDGNAFVSFTTDLGLVNNIVWSIEEDKAGNLWFGTEGGGISRYDGYSFTNYTSDQGLANNIVWSIEEDKAGNLWFGTFGGGVSCFDGHTFTNYTSTHGLTNNVIWSIEQDKTENLWFGTFGGGVSRYDGASFCTFTTDQGLAHNDVFSITEDKSGNLWFGTFGGGVSRYDGEFFLTFTTDQGLAHNNVWSITEDKAGNLWFGTVEGLSVIPAGEMKMLTQNPVLSAISEPVESGMEGEYKEKKVDIISSTLFKSFKIADGLPDNYVTQVIQMPDGKMAVGTNQGITLFNPSDDFTKLTDIEIYSSGTGYPVKNVNVGQNGMFLDSKGMIWAGTGSGKTALVRFDYAALRKEDIKLPTLVIKSVRVQEEPINWYSLQSSGERNNQEDSDTTLLQEYLAYGKNISPTENESIVKRFGSIQFNGITRFYPLPENLVLPYKHNQISFEFVAIETSRPFIVNYQYMLEGYSKDWSPVTKRSNASFGNMTEGTYTFKLKAQGANGVWTDPISYTFKVLPPWWRTWWAYVGYAVLLGLLVFVVNRVQRQRLIKKERARAEGQRKELELKKAAELKVAYDELKATQTQLIHSEKMASLGELTAGIAHEIQNPLNFVNNFSEVSTELLDEMKEEFKKGDVEEGFAIANDIKQNLEKINHHGKRADAIVKGMLEHSRTSTGQKVPTDTNALCDEYLRLAYHGLRAKDKSFNAEMITDFDTNLPKIEVIPQDIGRVLLNIINNAFFAVNERKTKGEDGNKPTVWVSTKLLEDKILISVRDNGSGIPTEIKDKIFQPFFTTKPTGQGTGLGLSLSYDIIKAHGGELTVESEVGKGSEFRIQLPV